jgi:hypothetical protein
VTRFIYAAASIGLILSLGLPTQGHDVITTHITFDREISRIIYDRCALCHRDGGTAFSLMTYEAARPWAVAIKDETLSRRMPPWGAVKGFGEFRNDQGLTAEQLELIMLWVDGGAPEGNVPDLPAAPKFTDDTSISKPKDGVVVSGDHKLDRAFALDGIWLDSVRDDQSLQISAELPNGVIEPLLWLYEYKSKYAHPFLLRTPLDLPPGTVIRGVPPDSKVILIPTSPTPTVEPHAP